MGTSENSVPPAIGKSKRKIYWGVSIAFAVIVTAACVLFFFDPVQAGFYPQCMFRKVTGLSCPACGCLRASHQLLHGNVSEAIRLNVLFVSLIPICGWIAIRGLRGKENQQTSSKVFAWSLLIAAIVFAVLRNLPFFAAWSAK